jgi:2,3-bisphosphoglycerate-independent phosphoglycerate mutase
MTPEGHDPGEGRDAVAAANTPAFDRYVRTGAYGTLDTTGRSVGLPAGQMGNSEVGHLTIGAGRPVKQAFTRIEDAIDAGTLADTDAVTGAFDHVVAGGRVHLVGLVSDGGVHSHRRHVHALVRAAADRGVEAVTHAITDGRDTPPKSGAGFLADLEAVTAEAGTGDVATVVGRYYAMDRDENWDRTRRAYDALVSREADHEADSAVEAVRAAYGRGETDEFVEPTLVDDGHAVDGGDAVFVCNFRADRARQLVRMLGDVDPEWDARTDPPDVHLATMTEYDRDVPFPVAFPPNEPKATFGSTLAAAGRTQLRVAESEKYAHVTYFLNGGREVEFDDETRRIVDSPDVPTYDLRPEMSAPEVTDTAVSLVTDRDPDALVLNYANPDMVGHTGDFEATVAACEAVDDCLSRLVGVCHDAGAAVLVTADHGNADDVGTPEDPHTAHTTNPVPFVALAADATLSDPSGDPTAGASAPDGFVVREGGTLADVTPTALTLAGLSVPEAMTGRSLLVEG